MDIMELGAIGELVGDVAVVATLVYLALQVRTSTEQARQSAPGVRAWWHGNIYDDRPIQTSSLFSVEVRRFVSQIEDGGLGTDSRLAVEGA